MKNPIHLAVVRLLSAVICGTALTALAAVPVRWTAETSRVQPIALDAWRGDTLALECTLKSYGQQVSLGAATASLMWQTNGMGATWWQTNATVSADGVISATWSPSMDPGAPAVAFFLPVQTGGGASYRAAGTLRFRPSPGAGSQIAELPQPGGTLDFGEFNLVNAPWATLEAANEAISAAVTSATGALVIPPPVDLGPYATTCYVAGAITSATGALVIPPPADLTPYATTGAVSAAVQTASNALAGQIQAVSNAAMPRAEMGAYATQADVSTAIAGIQIPSLAGYATQSYVADYFATSYTPQDLSSYASRSYADAVASNAQANAIAAIPSLAGYATQSYVADYFATNYTPPDLSSYASRSYADAVASNAQANAIAAIPSLAGYATESYVVDYFATNYTPPDLSSYASRSYADSAASNAQANAIAAIPSLAGYATETYAQNAASAAASDALSAAQSYARDLSWGASEGNTRLVSLDGTIWQDATGTVWQTSEIYGWSGTVIDLSTSAARPITFNYAGKIDTFYTPNADYWSAGGGTNLYFATAMYETWALWFTNTYYGAESNSNWIADGTPPPSLSATNITISTSNEFYRLYYRPVALATNPVDRVLYSSDSVFRALTYGTPTRWTDATGCVWEVQTTRVCADAEEEWTYTIDGQTYTREQMIEAAGGDDLYSMILDWEDSTFINKDEVVEEFEGWYVLNGSGTAPIGYNYSTGLIPSYASDPYLAQVTYNGNITATRGDLVTVTNLVGRVAYTNDLPTTPSAVGAAPASIVPVLTSVSNDAATAKLNSETALRIVLGESVWFAVTNCMRTAEGVIPSLQLWEVRDGATNLVYDSREEITNTVRALTTELRTELESRIPSKAWGNYQSDGTDNPQPGEVAIINPPTIILTGGGTFNKYIEVGDSSVWVLQSSGSVSFGGNTNGNFFAVLDDEGNTHFKVAKTDSYDLPMFISDILPRQSQNHILIYTATTNRQGNAVAQPVLFAANDLKNSTWHEEVEGEIDALGITVSWAKDETIPAWVATITPDVWYEKMFFRAKVTQEGGVAVINTAPVRFDGGVQIGNGTYRLVPYTMGGKTYLTVEGMP